MKKLILGCLLLTTVFTQQITAQKAPVIDRQLFFGNPEIASGTLSPDGKYIAFMKEYEGIMNIWVKKIDEPFEKARLLTDSKRPFGGFFWTRDSKYIVYGKDKDGDENINIYAVNPTDLSVDSKVPESRNLTPMKDVQARITMVSKLNPNKLMVEINDRDKAWHDLYELEIASGKLTKIRENTDRTTGYDFDWDEKLRLVYKTDDKGTTVMYRVNADNSITQIYETNVTEGAGAMGWNEDNSKIYLLTNKGDLNLSVLYLMDVQTLGLEKIASDPKNKVDISGVYLNELNRKLTSIDYLYDKKEIVWHDKEWEKIHADLKKKFKGKEVDFQSITIDRKKFLITVWGDKYVSETYFYDSTTKDLIYQYTPRPALKKVEKYLSEMTPITYKSSDGLEIPAYLSLPYGKKVKNLPLVVLVHGGPKGPRDAWGFDGFVQFLTNRGYAVLQPNFRASGGYGKAFLNAGDKQWGKLMQDDITWGVKHLIDTGVADKSKIAIMGGSYGGYATLAGLAFTPDLYACGVDIVGPSNLFTLLESVPPYWEVARAFLHAMVGDPNTPEGKKLMQEASPLFSVDKIEKPLLIIQGANDPRVKQAEADQIVIALRDKGKPVTYLLADDEGHGFRKPVNNMATYAEAEKFLATHLGGVYQAEMPEDVAKRLNELRVDISKVVYEAKKEVTTEKSMPKIENQFKVQTSNYDVTIEIQGQKIPIQTTRTVASKGVNWVVKDVSKSMMGEQVEEMEFTSDFMPLTRKVSQMGQNITGVYTSDKFTISMQGRTMEIPFTGAYVSDGAGLDMVIAGLPLKENYTLAFEMPDLMTAKAKKVNLKVLGEEVINTKKCTKVQILGEGNDEILLWINLETKSAEQMIFIVPALGNAKMTWVKK